MQNYESAQKYTMPFQWSCKTPGSWVLSEIISSITKGIVMSAWLRPARLRIHHFIHDTTRWFDTVLDDTVTLSVEQVTLDHCSCFAECATPNRWNFFCWPIDGGRSFLTACQPSMCWSYSGHLKDDISSKQGNHDELMAQAEFLCWSLQQSVYRRWQQKR